MIEVKETYLPLRTAGRKTIVCPKCGYEEVFYYTSPTHCEKCDTELPDVISMLEGLKIVEKKLEFHRTGRVLKRPARLKGEYD